MMQDVGSRYNHHTTIHHTTNSNTTNTNTANTYTNTTNTNTTVGEPEWGGRLYTD